MDKFAKFLAKIDARLSASVRETAVKILSGEWEGLDIQPLKGRKNHFRCRIGSIRLIFIRVAQNQCVVLDAGFRGEIYKRWK